MTRKVVGVRMRHCAQPPATPEIAPMAASPSGTRALVATRLKAAFVPSFACRNDPCVKLPLANGVARSLLSK